MFGLTSHGRVCATAVALIASGLAACDSVIGPGPTAAVPVIQSLLVAGDSIQTAWVEWRVPADSAFGPEVRPVAPTLVQLSLTLPGGGSVPFTPAAGAAGRFDAVAEVDPGARYHLVGTVAGLSVSAEAMVPGQVSVRSPQQDTVSLSQNACVGGLCTLPFHWIAAGAAAYFYLQSRADRVVGGGSTTDTVGVIRLFRQGGGADTVRLSVFALEPNAAAFLLPDTPKGSITGVFGLFGAASRAERWIVLP